MKVAGAQIDIAWENPVENLARADHAAKEARALGASLFVLPEMFGTGFSMQADIVCAHSARIHAGASEIAKRHGLWVLAGIAEVVGERPHNAAVVFDPSGRLAEVYHKIHPFTLARENEHYEGGGRIVTIDVLGVRVTPVVCYDLRFPEIFRVAAPETDLFCVIANWPEARRHAWRSLLPARAIENQAFVLGVNRAGMGDGLEYSGDSALIDPFGEAIASAARQPGLVVGDVDSAAVRRARERFSFLADRRPEVYRRAEKERGR